MVAGIMLGALLNVWLQVDIVPIGVSQPCLRPPLRSASVFVQEGGGATQAGIRAGSH